MKGIRLLLRRQGRAFESLGRILGEAVGEDLVNEIFSKFCVGK